MNERPQWTARPTCQQRHWQIPALSLALVVSALGASGCLGRARVSAGVVYTPPVAEVELVPVEFEAVPVEVESYPSYSYAGGYVYLVEGRWYRRSANRWVVYREEPRDLVTVRVGYEAKYGRHYRPRPRAPQPRHPAPGDGR